MIITVTIDGVEHYGGTTQVEEEIQVIVTGLRSRVIVLEDAITEAGLILSKTERISEAADVKQFCGDIHTDIKKAMLRLGAVMNDPAILKRQGI